MQFNNFFISKNTMNSSFRTRKTINFSLNYFGIIMPFLLVLFCWGFQSLYAQEIMFQKEEHILYDSDRQRFIPIQVYEPVFDASSHSIVIINHGYGVKNTEYSFIAGPLCQAGYVVICIQHDLPDDPELPRTGNLFERRKPLWEQGVQNILFVLNERINTKNQLQKIILIGHSNGGDIAMLFGSIYPLLVEKIISLDSLRMPFPTKDHIPILSLRANDTKADNDVIPESGALIVELNNAKHIDMYDAGPEVIKEEILFLIQMFLGYKK